LQIRSELRHADGSRGERNEDSRACARVGIHADSKAGRANFSLFANATPDEPLISASSRFLSSRRAKRGRSPDRDCFTRRNRRSAGQRHAHAHARAVDGRSVTVTAINKYNRSITIRRFAARCIFFLEFFGLSAAENSRADKTRAGTVIDDWAGSQSRETLPFFVCRITAEIISVERHR